MAATAVLAHGLAADMTGSVAVRPAGRRAGRGHEGSNGCNERRGEYRRGARAEQASPVSVVPAPREDEHAGLPVTEITDEDYRCVWRPCPALEEDSAPGE